MGIKFHVNEHFFSSWSNEMAYVLGLLYADGHLINAPQIRAKYVCLTSVDLDRIETVRSLLGSQHQVIKTEERGNYKAKYLIRIGNANLFKSLEAIGLTPHKSMTMQFPNVPDRNLPAFIRGYFDGDGCVYVRKISSTRPTHLKTIFTSGSKKFLIKLQKYLKEKAKMEGGGLYEHGSTKGTYQLRYAARDSIRLFQYMYKNEETGSLALRRKYDIFMTYFKKLGLDKNDFPTVLKRKGPVVKG